jgi:hypothetical protein
MWLWIGLAKDRNRWRAVVNSVLNLHVEAETCLDVIKEETKINTFVICCELGFYRTV